MTKSAAPSPALQLPLHQDGILAGWIIEVATGNQLAFRSLYQATSAKLFGTILRLLHDRQESEDILQEVYTKVWRTAASYDALRGRPITWLITIARHRAIDRLRARPPQTAVILYHVAEIPDSSPSAEVLITMSQDAQRLHAALAKLPPRFAAAIRSAYLDGLTYEALAAAQEIPISTLKSWVRRGIAQMRADLLESP